MDYKKLEADFAESLKGVGKLIHNLLKKQGQLAAEEKDVIKQLIRSKIAEIPDSPDQAIVGPTSLPKKIWHPLTFLGMGVNTAGFDYCCDQDIIYSTMYNYQRLLGYCDFYDDTSLLILSRIDSEVIYFDYEGYKWRIELWKGQYGIETGCEVGIYRRDSSQPLTEIEKKFGALYACVPDSARLAISFELKTNSDQTVLTRKKQKHWWLTGFRWGSFEKPDNLHMNLSIEFTDSNMMDAFVTALTELGYTEIKTMDNTVSFCFAKPKSKQPSTQEEFGDLILLINKSLVNCYNLLKEDLGIKTNDPNTIWNSIKGIDINELLSVKTFEEINDSHSLFGFAKAYVESRFFKKLL